jgi:penicillin amidase
VCRRTLGAALALGAAALAAVALAGPPRAAATQALVVLPPGQGGTITAAALARNQLTGDCSDLAPHACDQLQTYQEWRFRDGALAPTPAQVLHPAGSETPIAGLQIVRDGDGVPHIYASGPDEAAIEGEIAYGIGYAQAEDRLFQMEILRRAAEGTLSELLGSSYEQMDLLTRRDSETAAERAEQIAALSPTDRASLQRYADGINAVIARDTQDASQLPAGFAATQDEPVRPWTSDDTVAVIVLETKQVAESAGNEVGYGSLARRLASRYGVEKAVRILDDLQLTRDPKSPTTVPHGQGARRTTDLKRYGFIDYTPADTARLVSSLDPSVDAADQEMLTGDQALAQADSSLGLPRFGSNAWAIAPRRSRTGGALLWGAPQVGYYFPPVLYEMEVQGGASHIHGVGVPGGGPGIVIGYTPHLAWSITTAQDDQVDTYVDRIRAAPGGGYEFFWRGAWRPVAQRQETIRVRTQTPNLALIGQSLGTPVYTDKTVTFYRTEHGPPGTPLPCAVFYLDPHAGLSYCKVRAFWNAELQTGRALVDMNQATDLAAFDRAVHESVAGFNFIYADDQGNIAYWHTGRVPVRVRGHDPRLPVPGDGSYDWQGFLTPADWPSVVDPAQGWVASWNNKPQASWPDSGDGTLWGAFQRVRQPMSLIAAQSRLDSTTVWQVARRTGELDLRATLGFKPLLTTLAARTDLSPLERRAVDLVAAWDGTAFYPDGAERDASGKPTGRVAGAAFPIFDAWFAALEQRVAAPVFGPVVSGSDAANGVRAFTRTPQTESPQYEFFDDFDAFVYDALTGRAHAADYLGGATASDVSKAALDDALGKLSSAQGADPDGWRAPMPQIVFQDLEVGGVPNIPWENRGTWGEAVTLPAPPGCAPAGPAARTRPSRRRARRHRPVARHVRRHRPRCAQA